MIPNGILLQFHLSSAAYDIAHDDYTTFVIIIATEIENNVLIMMLMYVIVYF